MSNPRFFMRDAYFLPFNFCFGVKRLVFAEVMRPTEAEKAPSMKSDIESLLNEPEKAHEGADKQADEAKAKGHVAMETAKAEARRLRDAGGGSRQNETEANFTRFAQRGEVALARIEDPAHGRRHMVNVLQNAWAIEREIQRTDPDVDLFVASAAAVWHDTGRSADPKEHETLSALWAHNEALRMGFSVETATKIFDAIYRHKWSDMPKTLEGNILRDADKLDFLDIGRWQKRIEGKKHDELEYVTGIFIDLRGKLQLDASRTIFDKRLPAFLDFVESVKDEGFEPMKKQILSKYGRIKE